MRRAVAAAILGISFWIGSLAWSGFLLTSTVLDPSRSERVAENLYDDEVIRNQLADNLAGAVEASLPDGVTVERPVLEGAARAALASPAVEAVIKDAFVRSHQAFLGSGDAPESLDAGAFGVAARESLVAARPDLAGVLPAAPSLVVPLPTDRIPNLGPVRDVIDAAVPVLALAAAAGVASAFVIAKNRPAILRRAGFWAIGLSATVLAFAYGIPWLSERFAPDQSAVVAALVNAMAEQTRGPAVAAALAGVGSIGASFVWKATPAVLGAFDGGGEAPAHPGFAGARPDRPPAGMTASQAARWYQRRDLPTPPRRTDAAAAAPVRPREPDGFSARDRGRLADPTQGYPTPVRGAPGAAPTRVTPTPAASRPAPAPQPAVDPTLDRQSSSVERTPDGRRVVSSAEEIPDDAHWVPGVGYVVDDT